MLRTASGMTSKRATLLLPVALAAALLTQDRPAGAQDDEAVVVRVGSTEITVGEVADALAKMPPHQRQKFGKTPEEIRKAYVEQVATLDALYVEHARVNKLDQVPKVHDRIRDILRRTLENRLREDMKEKSPISDTDVAEYYEENKTRYVTPRRLQIWRILVKDKALAESIIKQVQGTDGPKTWTKLAREHSIDDATKMREGNLGFVRPDGATDRPRVKVDPALFEAANKVKNGAVVPQPVNEGGKWAVVWRRGGMRSVTRAVDDEAPQIRQILLRKKLVEKRDALVDKLWKDDVGEVNAALVKYVKIDNGGDVGGQERPGTVPRRPSRKDPTPKKTEKGLR